ncbi:MAG TPA: PVC-type heme-binding CxxCH protein, partial [Cyclobacteriaceae bacterium]|nr:PVC-type heme-binding CxxCH protein [Cyclobacteriaceae bacterium]
MSVFKKSINTSSWVKLSFFFAFTILMGCAGDPQIELNEGDRIAVIGNSLAERMQHDGWLETYFQASHPDRKLVFRNFGYSGDQVHYRPRAHEGFGDSDSHLDEFDANVIFSFFGYNESYEDQPEVFKEQLTAWIDHVRSQKYDSVNTPRIVMFSPIAHENLEDPNLPDGSENNRRLSAYTQAMAEVAQEKETGFVDLFNASQEMYESSEEPLTINGVHLNPEGNRQIGLYIAEAVLGKEPQMDQVALDSLRSAVVEKNALWFSRYRAISGNDVWGTRSIQDGNRATLKRELDMLDVMVANRDEKIWARANGEDLEVDDSNVPDPLIVGTHITRTVEYIDPVEAIDRMTVPDDLQVNLFAAEDKFPEIVNPVAMQVDTKGRIWVASWGTYPKQEPLKPMNDRLVFLTDDDGDGEADKATTFAYVPHPTGFEFWNDGVVVISAPDILYLKDTTGDDVADVRVRLFGGLGADDTHHTANNLIYGPDGNIYYQRGIFILENVETPWRRSEESGTPGLYRFNPRTFDFSFVVENTPNAHGISIDKYGNLLITDGTSGRAFQVYYKRTVTSTTDTNIFDKRPLFQQTIRPVTANGLISSEHFPEEYQNNFLVYNVIGFQGIKRYQLEYKEGGVVEGKEVGNLLFTGNDPTFTPHSEAAPRVIPENYTGDPNFRPTDGVIGPDGALYFSDWQNAVITHSPYNLRDISRDQAHGRIYRITAKNRPLQKPVAIDGEPVERLLELFRHPVDGIRHQVRVELSGRDTKEVIQKAQEWAKNLDPQSEEDALPMLEILWLHQQHNVQNRDLLVTVLKSPVENVRIAAQKVAWFWSERNSHLRGGTGSDISGMQFRTFYEGFWQPDSAGNVTDHAAHKPPVKPEPAKKEPAKKEVSAKNIDLTEESVASLTIKAELLAFDVKEFTVKADQKVELTLENLDLMQHNLLI